jgi:biopolymer transport protein ExbD
MTFGAFDSRSQRPLMPSMSDINVTPMVDVMLVLLVIFIITAPMLTQAVKLDLPRAESSAAPSEVNSVVLAIDARGNVFWNDEALGSALTPGMAELDIRLAQAARLLPQPELELRFDKETRYEVVAQVMAQAQAKGLSRFGFVTEPGLTPLKEKK